MRLSNTSVTMTTGKLNKWHNWDNRKKMGVKEERKFHLIEEEMESIPRRCDMSNLFHDYE